MLHSGHMLGSNKAGYIFRTDLRNFKLGYIKSGQTSRKLVRTRIRTWAFLVGIIMRDFPGSLDVSRASNSELAVTA